MHRAGQVRSKTVTTPATAAILTAAKQASRTLGGEPTEIRSPAIPLAYKTSQARYEVDTAHADQDKRTESTMIRSPKKARS